ncbi:GNAT family N-acetyltransferase [Kribbella sandramycini]|uniref:GNAT family N-acetyltransferase n=1 Tax=Kribbella sandramycini TaxID=60450 RepID=A0A7Y4L4F4_9ACTN|nr:GNAT family N-acetyltransferase [Kribbella sandramycini]MBB6571534.1 GNAT superfamily N-acetyltransferase [Kribbella sandramycini]NOL44183.1 GNAT family N-acetyltransferase [Kribbella sandramycini]
MNLVIRALQPEDPPVIAAAFAQLGWPKPQSQYERYLEEQQAGARDILVAFLDDRYVGYVTIRWESPYEPFAGIPEIQDFNVLPEVRRRGIGTALMDAAEARVATRSPLVGIGVGLYPDYGAAQRMYVRRGYLPDGRGLIYDGHQVPPMQTVPNDDNLTLMFTKQL